MKEQIKEGQVNLNYYQVMIFLWKLEKLKNGNDAIAYDSVVFNFFAYVLMKLIKIEINYNTLPFETRSNLKLYTISENDYQHLVALTSINPLDFNEYKQCKFVIDELSKRQTREINRHMYEVANGLVEAKILKRK